MGGEAGGRGRPRRQWLDFLKELLKTEVLLKINCNKRSKSHSLFNADLNFKKLIKINLANKKEEL